MSGHGPAAEQAGSSARPYFALVIGSGFGGAVTACRLAQARAARVAAGSDELPIALLERGRRFSREDFPRLQLPDYLTADPDRLTSKRLPDIARLFWTHDQGLWELRNLGELRVAQAAGLGGGSLIYGNVHLRPPQVVFDGWPSRCGESCACAENEAPGYNRTDLRRYYDLVADMLDIEPLPAAQQTRYGKTSAMAKVARSLFGGPDPRADAPPRFLHPPLAVRFEPCNGADGRAPNRFGREQGTCTGCGNCTIGCQEGAKNTLDLNYLAVAEDLGVEVRTLCEVLSIEPQADGPLKVHFTDHLQPGNEPALHAQHVFLCAGAVGSTEILLRSRALAGRTRPPLGGERLGHTFFANGDNLAALFDTEVELDPSAGPTITTTLVHTAPSPAPAGASPRPPIWFLIQDGGIPPSLAEAMGLFRSPLWLARNRFRPPTFAPRPTQATAPGAARPLPELRVADFRPAAALARGLRQLVPRTLDPLLDRLRRVDEVASAELRSLNARVIRTIDQRIRRSRLLWPLRPMRALFATEDRLLGAVAGALAEQYPVVRDLFSAGRPMELLLSLARHLLFVERPSSRSGLLLVMGPDQKGKLVYQNGHLFIRWQNVENTPLYSLQERLLRDAAAILGGELRTNPDWTLGRTPLTVHAQGGCSMSARPETGVVKPCGQLWTSPGVYVMDASAFPGSVGVNPSSTIAAVAERNIEQFIRRTWGLAPEAYRNRTPDPARQSVIDGFDRMLAPTLPEGRADVPRSRPVGLEWQEEMNGHIATDPAAGPAAFASFSRLPLGARTELDIRPFLSAERRGPLAGLRVDARLDVSVPDLDRFLLERRPRLLVKGTTGIWRHVRAGRSARERHHTEGHIFFELLPDDRRPASRLWAQERKLVAMTYDLKVKLGRRQVPLLARKLIADDPGMDFWSDLSTLFVVVKSKRWWVGVMRVQLSGFLHQQLRNMRVLGDADPAGLPLDDLAKGWAFMRFASFFVGNVKNVYSQWL